MSTNSTALTMPKQEGEGSLETLMSAFRDANLGMSRRTGFPYVPNETAQSHLFRIMDFWNIEMWDDASTNAISEEVIRTLLQCAARLYEDKIHAPAAVDLIESTHTRAILSLGIQDVLCRVVHRQDMENMRSDKSEERNAENHKLRAGLFSALRRNKARQLNHQAMIFKHISSLCCSHSTALQSTFDSPRIDEQFMFRNYITLSNAFNLCEKSWLVALLPDIFRWEGQDICGITKGEGQLASNFSATKGTNWNASSNVSMAISPAQPAITSNVIRSTYQNANISREKTTPPESVECLRGGSPWSPGERSPSITVGMVQSSLGQATTVEDSQFQAAYGESGMGNSNSDLESLTLTTKELEFEKGVDLLRKRVMNHPKPPSDGAFTPALKAPYEFHDQTTSQKEGTVPVGKTVERKGSGDYPKGSKRGLLSLSGDISDGDWNTLESDDETIFPFSPDSYNDAANCRLAPTDLHGADKEQHACMSPARGARPPLSAPSLQSTNRVRRQSSNFLEPGEWTRRRLWVISEEVDERQSGPETALKVEDTALPELVQAFHDKKRVVILKKPLGDDHDSGANYYLE